MPATGMFIFASVLTRLTSGAPRMIRQNTLDATSRDARFQMVLEISSVVLAAPGRITQRDGGFPGRPGPTEREPQRAVEHTVTRKARLRRHSALAAGAWPRVEPSTDCVGHQIQQIAGLAADTEGALAQDEGLAQRGLVLGGVEK